LVRCNVCRLDLRLTLSGFVRRLFEFVVFFVLTLAVLWATAALYLDVRVHRLGVVLAALIPIAVAAVLFRVRPRVRAVGLCFGLFGVVVAWWLTLAPSNDGNWQGDVAQTPWAQVEGDKVTLHNFRNFDYTTETDYTPHWETRTVDLSQIKGIDFYMNYWGSPAIAHTILSFEFAGSRPVAISIETRKQLGQSYSALLGFFRQYSLIYIIGDERDIVRVRTNYRKGEDLYLYHSRSIPAGARKIFLDYLKSANSLHVQPQWYNALNSNCTTDILPHLTVVGKRDDIRWDWRILLNGYIDQMLYQDGLLAGDLPFDELKRRVHINEAAKAANDSPDFSRLIRVNRPGFEGLGVPFNEAYK
jgi:hypothetical protein